VVRGTTLKIHTSRPSDNIQGKREGDGRGKAKRGVGVLSKLSPDRQRLHASSATFSYYDWKGEGEEKKGEGEEIGRKRGGRRGERAQGNEMRRRPISAVNK